MQCISNYKFQPPELEFGKYESSHWIGMEVRKVNHLFSLTQSLWTSWTVHIRWIPMDTKTIKYKKTYCLYQNKTSTRQQIERWTSLGAFNINEKWEGQERVNGDGEQLGGRGGIHPEANWLCLAVSHLFSVDCYSDLLLLYAFKLRILLPVVISTSKSF